jgi:hypothetical protein
LPKVRYQAVLRANFQCRLTFLSSVRFPHLPVNKHTKKIYF